MRTLFETTATLLALGGIIMTITVSHEKGLVFALAALTWAILAHGKAGDK